uniref:Putative adenylate kinase n=1 Tax=Trypanosoma congolense (strain IL3000) TaxID=1068625 RepID=G0UV94_TRYCI|nr:putative adenylate kinase [Trypanosoma congolense IL3000]
MDLYDHKHEYLKEKNVPLLMEYILQNIVTDLPKDPMKYIGELMERDVSPNIIIAGPPASGKGTQCEAIARRFGVVHISTGELIRSEVSAGTEEGRELEEYMESGELVPDCLVTKLLFRRLQQSDVRQRGWLLDGFPRSSSQVAELEKNLINPHIFIILNLPDEAVYARIENRLTDPFTGKVYNLLSNPPPKNNKELCERLVRRADDNREAVARRLEVYREEISHLTRHYGSVMHVIDGAQPVQKVTQDVLEAIDRRRLVR